MEEPERAQATAGSLAQGPESGSASGTGGCKIDQTGKVLRCGSSGLVVAVVDLAQPVLLAVAGVVSWLTPHPPP